jgi:hypothetical protein
MAKTRCHRHAMKWENAGGQTRSGYNKTFDSSQIFCDFDLHSLLFLYSLLVILYSVNRRPARLTS